MEAFDVLDALAAPLDMVNVDTGLILPARYLRRPRNDGFQDYLFRDLRFEEDGSEKPDFVLNQPAYRRARILVADRNFGSGSSREQAAWGLSDYGIRCVIASSFGDIFHANAFKSGLLPVRLDAGICARLRGQLHARPGTTLRIDLPQQTVTDAEGTRHAFEIDGFRKRCLLEGVDDVGLTLRHEPEIVPFEEAYRRRFPWLFE